MSSSAPGTEGHEQRQQQQQQLQAAEQRRQMILGRILDGGARERLDRIGIVRPEEKRMIEDQLVRQAQMGMMQRVDENQIKMMMSSVSQGKAKTQISIQRKRYQEDDDDEDYGDL
ncbi:Double-stranded DNA-binding domain-containing protein [Plasmodiophora brassicae]|uniref:Double-stranded DNA-binding domain-containing protein n=1 Tax=Plasmodiophora brassicae TaxID=37360 RepID=A0A0G4IHB3_PLABS|nr:hypothetical protein PBRA_000287 [Plasmodiophora brassicae]SPQ96848.1 unnamed protein product [Plasmodiophora brassicae]